MEMETWGVHPGAPGHQHQGPELVIEEVYGAACATLWVHLELQTSLTTLSKTSSVVVPNPLPNLPEHLGFAEYETL